MSAEPGEARLGFVPAVRAAFDVLLVGEHQFRLVAEGGAGVRYDSDAVTVVIFRDRNSYELDLAAALLGPTPGSERSYSLCDVIRVSDPERAAAYRSFAATTPGAMRRGVARLAEQLRHYGEAALVGSPDFFGKMAKAREATARQSRDDHASRAARTAAAEAWRDGDFAGVVAAYSKATTFSPVDAKRLRLAERELRKQGPVADV